jgi:HEAT repeat protein
VARGDEAVVDLIVAFLGDDHPEVRRSAADVLANGPVEPISQRLLEALQAFEGRERPGVAASHVLALSALDVPCHGPVCEALLDYLEGDNADARFQAIVGLNRIGCVADRFREAAVDLLGDPDDEVAAVAATALTDFFGEATATRGASPAATGATEVAEQILQRWRGARGFAKRQLALAAAHLGRAEVISTLERAVRSGLDGLPAVDALVALGAEPAGQSLEKLANSWRVHPILKARAAVGLAELKIPAGQGLVRKNLRHRRADVRGATVEWIGSQALTVFTEDLADILADRESGDSVLAAQALAVLGGPRAQSALAMAADSDPREEVQREARWALAELSD